MTVEADNAKEDIKEIVEKCFKCGLCKQERRYFMTRKSLREHLKKEHRIMSNLTNSGYNQGYIKQKWWIEEEFK